MKFGVSSMTNTLRVVAVRKPGPSLLKADPAKWHYGPQFDSGKVIKQHESFVTCLTNAGCDVLFMENDDSDIADAVFTYDASLITPSGALLMSPGKPLRQGEQHVHRNFYESQGIPVFGEIAGDATAEAGDTLWLDDTVMAVGRGFRTNQSGIDQISSYMQKIGVTVKSFDVPYYQGREACLHLMSLVSLVDTRKALVLLELLPVALHNLMLELGYTLIPAPMSEFQSSGTLSTNVLTTSPGKCIMLTGLPKTRACLEAAGIEITDFEGNALCIGCEGGPTCLTRPVLRSH